MLTVIPTYSTIHEPPSPDSIISRLAVSDPMEVFHSQSIVITTLHGSMARAMHLDE